MTHNDFNIYIINYFKMLLGIRLIVRDSQLNITVLPAFTFGHCFHSCFLI